MMPKDLAMEVDDLIADVIEYLLADQPEVDDQLSNDEAHSHGLMVGTESD